MIPNTRESVTYMAIEMPDQWRDVETMVLPHWNGALDGVAEAVPIAAFDHGIIYRWYSSTPNLRRPDCCEAYELVYRWTRRGGYQGIGLRWMGTQP